MSIFHCNHSSGMCKKMYGASRFLLQRLSQGYYCNLRFISTDQSDRISPYTRESDVSPFTMQSSRRVPSCAKPSFSSTFADATLRVSASACTRFRSSVLKAQCNSALVASVAKPCPHTESLRQYPMPALRKSGFHLNKHQG